MENTFFFVSIIHHFPVEILDIKLPEHDSYLEMWVKANTFHEAVSQVKHNELDNSIIYDDNGKKFDFAYINIDDYDVKCNDAPYSLSSDEKELVTKLKQIYLDAIKERSVEQ